MREKARANERVEYAYHLPLLSSSGSQERSQQVRLPARETEHRWECARRFWVRDPPVRT